MKHMMIPFEKIQEFEANFDLEKNMVLSSIDFSNITKLNTSLKKMHNIMFSFQYALYLFSLDNPTKKETAVNIVKTLLDVQCLDKNSKYYGFWPFFYEQPVSRQVYIQGSVDLGEIPVILIQIYVFYSSFFSEYYVEKMKNALIATIFSFMSDYHTFETTSLLQYGYSALKTGELFNLNEFVKFGEQLISSAYKQVSYHGSFFEFNDLVRFSKNAKILVLIDMDTENSLCRDLSHKISDIFWENTASNFHYYTMQFSGPLSMTEDDSLTESFYNSLYSILNGKVYIPHTKELQTFPICPEKYYPYFSGEKMVNYTQKLISFGSSFPYYRFSSVVTSYMTPKYTLSSFNREEFWHMRRPFIGYFGHYNTGIYCYKISVLHNFQDYSSAALHCIQEHGYALGHITFHTNRGDIDMDANFSPDKYYFRDLRIRFQITGNISQLEITSEKNSVKISHNGVLIYYSVPFCEFGKYSVEYSIEKKDNSFFFDTIIYSGEETVIDLCALKCAITEFSFLITSSNKRFFESIRSINDNILHSSLNIGNIHLSLDTKVNPDTMENDYSVDAQSINNIILEKHAITTKRKFENYSSSNNSSLEENLSIMNFDNNNKFSELINTIKTCSSGRVEYYFNSALGLFSETTFTIDILKYIAVQLVSALFEWAKSNNYNFKKIIHEKYFNIYQSITIATDKDTIILELTKLLKSIKKDNAIFENQSHNALIKKVLNLIDENLLNSNLSLDYIAEKFEYSSEHISRIFTNEIGISYTAYIQKMKIDYAIEQLTTNKTSIKAVSQQLGYSNPSNFMRMFHKVTGMTIKEYLNNL